MKFLSKLLDRQRYFYHKEDDGSFTVYDRGTEKLGSVWETNTGWIATLGEGQPNLEGGPDRESATAVLEMAAQVKKNCKHLRLDNSRIFTSNPPKKKCLDCGKYVAIRSYVDLNKALKEMKNVMTRTLEKAEDWTYNGRINFHNFSSNNARSFK